MEDKVKEVFNAYNNPKKASHVTDFLEPGVLADVLALIHKNHLSNRKVDISYGFSEGERGRFIFAPDFMETNDETAILEIRWKNGKHLTHCDFLGALLHQGIKREKIGDILVEDENCRIAIDNHLVDYVMLNLEKIGQVPVTITLSDNRTSLSPKLKEFMITVHSLRLDAIVSKGFGISRNESASLIHRGHVKVNFKIIEKVDHLMKEKDLISCVGFGRIKTLDILGKSSKDRYKVLLGKFI